jgi:hypothetical protein
LTHVATGAILMSMKSAELRAHNEALATLQIVGMATEFAATLQRYAADLQNPVVAAANDRLSQAAILDAQADTYANRSNRFAPGSEQHLELQQRASNLRRRAAALRSGEAIPRELRTPLDRLDLVSRARDALIAATVALDELEPSDVVGFLQALLPPAPESDTEVPGLPTMAPSIGVRNTIGEALAMLGVYRAEDGSTRARAYGIEVAAERPQARPIRTQVAPAPPSPIVPAPPAPAAPEALVTPAPVAAAG